MNRNKEIILNLIICSIILFITMVFFIYLNYIDISVIKAIYLPIYLIILVSILFKQFIFGYFFTLSATIGLMTEYIIHKNQVNPSMKGASFNIIILLIGAAVGIIIQLLFKKKKKDKIY